MFLNCTIGIFNQTVGQPGERSCAMTIQNLLPQEICKPPTETENRLKKPLSRAPCLGSSAIPTTDPGGAQRVCGDSSYPFC